MSAGSLFSAIAVVIRGVAFDKAEVKLRPCAGYVPILRAGNIQDELVTDRDLVWVPESRVAQEQQLQLGDIAVAVSSGSAALVGKSARLDQPWVGSVGAFCAIVRPNKRVDSEYLAYWFRSPAFNKWRNDRTRGSNIQNLRLVDLAEVSVPTPAVETQREFAYRLRLCLSLANAARSAIANQSELGAALDSRILSAGFGGVAPIALDAESNVPGGWRTEQLLSLARLESGHTPSRRHPEWWGGDVPWLALPDIRKLHGLVAHDTAEHTNHLGLANSSARMLPVGTVCVSRTASIGFVTMLGRPMATSQDFCNWVCDPDKLDAEYLMYAFMASFDYLRELGSGAVHKTIYMPTIQSFHLATPPLAEQRRIAQQLRGQLAAARTLRDTLAERQREIERLPQRILAAAFGDAV